MRAFLSHSSSDKPLVRQVADRLGRAKVVFDVFEFNTADEFGEAIERGINRSDVFVLFASRASLASKWVQRELSQAESDFALKALSRIAVYIVDDDLKPTDLPDWLKKSLVTTYDNPQLIALDIQRVINEVSAARRPNLFVGRSQKLEEAGDLLAEGVSPLIVSGLGGIGRRTFISEVARSQLSYPKVLSIALRPGDELAELLLYARNALGLTSAASAKDFLELAATKTSAELTLEIISLFEEICNTGTLPLIIDSGALTTDDGYLLGGFSDLLDSISQSSSVDAGIASPRRIRSKDGVQLRSVRLQELDIASSQRLLKLLAMREKQTLSRPQLEALSTYVAGYPPAATFAIDEIRAYGADHVLNNQRTIVNFNAQIFISQLSSDRKITPFSQRILQLLSAYSPLPREVIVDYVKPSSDTEMSESISYLMDYSFIVSDGPHYRIAAPIRDAAYRTFSGLLVDHSKLAALLEEYLRVNDEDELRLEISQALFRSLQLSGKSGKSAYALGLASDVISLTTQSYHDQNYDTTLSLGEQAVAIRPNNVDVRRVLAQALVRRERYDEAEIHIEHMISLGAFKEAFYVRGFLERRQRHHGLAIDAYKKSIEYGRGGSAVHRELAQCYFESGDLPQAQAHIRLAEQSSPQNKFVVDLKCTIAMRTGDTAEAERCLRLLERIDTGGFALHRRSIFELKQGNIDDALKYAESAVENAFRPGFEILANLANCQIENGKLPEAADHLRTLDQRFPSTHHDARTGLRIKLELRRGETAVADALSKKIQHTDRPVHMALRLSVLKQKGLAGPLSAEEEAEYSRVSATLDFTDERHVGLWDGVED